MSESDADVRALVAGHGDFAAGIVSAVGQITGRGEAFVDALESRHERGGRRAQRCASRWTRGAIEVIFTDLPAGSCTMAARRLQRERPAVVLVTGTNLATLLDFVFHTDVPAGEAARHAADKGRSALVVTGGAPSGH